MRFRRSLAVSGALALISLGGLAAVRDGAPRPSSDELRQFDFWLGEWTVKSVDGGSRSTHTVERVADGHGLLEQAREGEGSGALIESSLSVWNDELNGWQQFRVGRAGEVLELRGGREASGRMVLQGERVDAGRRVMSRLTWSPRADGTVVHRREQSLDGGRTWAVVFGACYERQPERTSSGGARAARAFYYLLW